MKKISNSHVFKQLFLLAAILIYSINASAKTVVFRCDDIRLNLDSQNIAMFKLFEKYNIHFTCAVIPFDEHGNRAEYDENNLNYLKSLQKRGIVEIALHGFAHIWTGTHGELDGLPYSEQYMKIKAGKQYLDSIFETDIVSFVPPRNNYDSSTVRILEELKFQNLSACSEDGFPLVQSVLNYIPFTSGPIREFSKDLRSSWGGVIILMYHPFEFNKEYSLVNLENDLQYINNNKIKSMTLSEATKSFCFDIKRIEYNKEHNLLTNIIPSLKQYCFSYSPAYIVVIWMLNILLYLIPIILSLIFCGKKNIWIVIAYSLLFIVVLFFILNHITPLKVWIINSFICGSIAIFNRLWHMKNAQK